MTANDGHVFTAPPLMPHSAVETPPAASGWLERHYGLVLAGVVLVALVIRLGLAHTVQGLGSPPDAAAWPDQIDYEEFAHQLSIGEGYSRANGDPTACRAPGTSFLLAPVYLLFGRSFFAARVWFCCLSAATCLVTGLLAGVAFGRRVGLCAALILTFDPGHFYYPIHLISEGPFCLFAVLGALFTCLALQPCTARRRRWDVLAGIGYGFATLIRPQMLLAVCRAPR